MDVEEVEVVITTDDELEDTTVDEVDGRVLVLLVEDTVDDVWDVWDEELETELDVDETLDVKIADVSLYNSNLLPAPQY